MNKLDKQSVTGISALLVHAAKIDEIYSEHEKNLIKDFIKSYHKDEDLNEILKKAEKIESDSNQLLHFTNIIKQIADIPAISVNPGLDNSKYSGLKAFSEGFGKEGVGAGGTIISSMLKTGNDSTKFLNLAEQEYDRLSAQRSQKS